MIDSKLLRWEKAISDLKDRLKISDEWYPIPSFISFGLIVIFISHLFPGLNPRLGSYSEVPSLQTKSYHLTGIWLGIYQKNKHIMIVSDERQVFSWPLAKTNQPNVQPLVNYLKDRLKKQLLTFGRDLAISYNDTRATLSVDKHLKYIHIRPILYALAEANISKYGFETSKLSLPADNDGY